MMSKNMEIKTDVVLPPGPYLYWIDDDGEWLGATPYKENITEEDAEQIKAELRKRYKKEEIWKTKMI